MTILSAVAVVAAFNLLWVRSSQALRPRPGRGTLAAVVVGCAMVTAAFDRTAVTMTADLVLPAGAGSSLVAFAVLIRRRRQAQRRANETSERVREICELLAADLSAGLPPPSALRAGEEVWPPWTAVVRADALGASVSEAMRSLAEHPGAADLVQVAAAWQISQRSGAALAQALSDVGSDLRAQAETRRVIRTELASARSTAGLVTLLPILTLAMGSTMGSPIRFLLATTPGQVCLLVGIATAGAGLWWIERIAAGVERVV